ITSVHVGQINNTVAPTTSVTDPTCSVPTGSIQVTSSTTGLVFSLDGGAFGPYPANGYSGLAFGSHTITARDVNGCSSTANVNVGAAQGAPNLVVNNPTLACVVDLTNASITV